MRPYYSLCRKNHSVVFNHRTLSARSGFSHLFLPYFPTSIRLFWPIKNRLSLQYLRQLPRQSKVKLQVLMTQYFTLMQQMAATNALLIKNESPDFIQSFEAVFALLIKQDRIIGSSNTALRQPYYTAYFLVRHQYARSLRRMGWLKHRPISLNRSLGSLYAITKVGPK